MKHMIKEEVPRGSRKQFSVTITDLDGVAMDPDTCEVALIKVGSNSPDSVQWRTCSKLGSETGVWGASIWIDESWTLGDWVAQFRWMKSGIPDGDPFYFTIVRKDKPYDNSVGPVIYP